MGGNGETTYRDFSFFNSRFKTGASRASLPWWLRHSASPAGGMASVPGQGTMIPQVTCGPKIEEEKNFF